MAALEQPVERFLRHTLGAEPRAARGARVEMEGRVKAGPWLPFRATEDVSATSFHWRARVAVGPVTLLRVTDRYADGRASVEGRLLGRVRLFRQDDQDTIRSAAGRTALECVIFAPAATLGRSDVRWRAESDQEIVATFQLPPEEVDVRVGLDDAGAMRWVCARRWGPAPGGGHAYRPCGGTVHAERRFGDLVLPSEFTVAWGFGTPSEEPFFRARIRSVEVTP